MAKYTYSVSGDTAAGKVEADVLKAEIQASAIVTAFDYILISGDVLDIYFKASLSSGDETILDGVVAAHAGVDPNPQYFYPAIPEDAQERDFTYQVGMYSSESDDYVVPTGKTLRLYELGGSGARSADCKIEIIWDPDGTPELLFSTHDALSKSSTRKLVGNGTKKLRIKLTNDTGQSETIGGYWIGRES